MPTLISCKKILRSARANYAYPWIFCLFKIPLTGGPSLSNKQGLARDRIQGGKKGQEDTHFGYILIYRKESLKKDLKEELQGKQEAWSVSGSRKPQEEKMFNVFNATENSRKLEVIAQPLVIK